MKYIDPTGLDIVDEDENGEIDFGGAGAYGTSSSGSTAPRFSQSGYFPQEQLRGAQQYPKDTLSQNGTIVDRNTGVEVGRFIVDSRGNVMIEPAGGRTVPAGRGGIDTHTTYPNGSNYQRLNPYGHGSNNLPHAHGHLEGIGPGMRGQGQSIGIYGNPVMWNSPEAHWTIK